SHAVLGIDVEQLWRDRGELQPLLDDLDADEEDSRNLFLAHAFLAQVAESAELIERMEGRTLDVFGARVLFGAPLRPDDAGNRRRAGQRFLLNEKLKGAIAPAASRNLEHAGLVSIAVNDRPNCEALEKRAPRDILREFLDRDAGLDTPDVGLAQH